MAIMDTVPAGYVFWDVSAKKSYAAGQKFPTLGEGDYLVPATSTYDGYYHHYVYHQKAYTSYDITYSNCWEGAVLSEYLSRTDHKLPFNYLMDKPVRWFSYSGCTFTSCPTKYNSGTYGILQYVDQLRWVGFWNCKNMTAAPNLPTALTSLNFSFQNTKVSSFPSNFSSLNNIKTMDYAFENTKISTYPDLSSKTTITSMKGTFSQCTSLTTTNKLPSSVIDTGYLFQSCTNITSAPEIPSKVTSVYNMFYGCTKLTGNIFINSGIISIYTNIFKNTTKKIILLTNGADQYNIAQNIANGYNNVYAGTSLRIISFTVVRGIYESGEFIEKATGNYCLLTCSFSSDGLQGGKLLYPHLEIDGVADDSLDWYLTSLDGVPVTDAGIQIPENGKIVSILYVGQQSTNNFSIYLRSNYVYEQTTTIYWRTGIINTTLTYSDLIIDINPLGTGIAIGKESEKDGVEIDWDTDINGELILHTSESKVIDNAPISISANIRRNNRPASNVFHHFLDIKDLFGIGIGRIGHHHVTDGGKDKEGLQFTKSRKVNGSNYYNTLTLYIDEDGACSVGVTDKAAWREALGLNADFIISQGTSGAWKYRKWNSGKIEAWGSYSFSAKQGSAWNAGLYYTDEKISVPSGIFTKVPRRYVTSNESQWNVYSVWGSSPTSMTVRFTKPNSNSSKGEVNIYLVQD